jgi:hypothetical protein
MKILLLLISTALWAVDSAVTYEFSGGRFGDNLLTYLHAKWISYSHQIPILYKPFPLSNDLCLHDKEALYTQAQGRTKRHIGQGIDPKKSYLYVCPYFPEDPLERPEYFYFDADWKNELFRAECLKLIAPRSNLQLTKPLKNFLNIAIHVREGGDFDHDDMKQKFPKKLPPLEFYKNGLAAVLRHLPGKPIYCHIFTDARVPQLILDSFKTAFPGIKFGCRQGFNRHDRNVLEDFFSLFLFDILIRPQSNFSIIPSLLHDYAIVHTPYGTEINETLYRRLLE